MGLRRSYAWNRLNLSDSISSLLRAGERTFRSAMAVRKCIKQNIITTVFVLYWSFFASLQSCEWVDSQNGGPRRGHCVPPISLKDRFEMTTLFKRQVLFLKVEHSIRLREWMQSACCTERQVRRLENNNDSEAWRPVIGSLVNWITYIHDERWIINTGYPIQNQRLPEQVSWLYSNIRFTLWVEFGQR